MTTNKAPGLIFPWQRSIASRMIVTIFLTLSAVIGATTALSVQGITQGLRSQVSTQLLELAGTAGQGVQRVLESRFGDVQVLAESPVLISDESTTEEKVAYLKSVQAAYGIYRALYVTDASGRIIAASDLTGGDQSAQEWFQRAHAGNVYASDMYFLPTVQHIVVTFSAPIYSESGALKGVVAVHVDGELLFEAIGETKVGEGGEIFLVNRAGKVVVEREVDEVFSDVSGLELVQAALNGESGSAIAPDFNTGEPALYAYTPLTGVQDWVAVGVLPLEEVNAPVTALANRTLLIAGASAALLLVALLVLTRSITRPIVQLSDTARRLSAGDFSTPVAVQSKDEIGQLAESFRTMAQELEDTIGSLEGRVASRTRDIQTVVAVSSQIATVLDVDRLLQDVVDLTKERFRLYHAHVYVFDSETNRLVLTAGAGHVGRQMVADEHIIDLYNPISIVARSARERASVPVQDVRESETFLPNPLLPDTYSELATPLVARGQLLGVLDVQSDQPDYFGSDTQEVIELLASQVANALNNARLFEAVERTSRHEQAIGNISRHMQQAVDIDDVLRVTVRELGKALRVPYTAIELKIADGNGSESSD